MNKKILFSLLLIILTFIILFVITPSKKKNYGEEKINITLPVITGATNVKAMFQFNLPQDISLPTKSPLISQNTSLKWNKEDINKIATNLSFTKEPLSFYDTILGKTYLFTESSSSLTIYPDAKIIRFSQQTPNKSGNKILDEEYIQIAESFVNQLSLKNIYRFSFFNYISTNPLSERYSLTTKESANTIQVNLSPVNKDIKIIIRSPDLSLATVTMDKSGNISKVEIRDLDEIVFSDQEYKLKNLDEIKNSTDNYILMTLDNGYYPDLELMKENIISINVIKIELAYFYDFEQRSVLQPVFLIGGTSKLKDLKDEVNISFYLPAYAQ